jgi:hypothetical protein
MTTEELIAALEQAVNDGHADMDSHVMLEARAAVARIEVPTRYEQAAANRAVTPDGQG